MKIKVHLSMGLVGCKREKILDIDDDEVEGLNEEELDAHLEEVARDWMFQQVEWGFEIVDPE